MSCSYTDWNYYFVSIKIESKNDHSKKDHVIAPFQVTSAENRKEVELK